jgi:hypothetical protein
VLIRRPQLGLSSVELGDVVHGSFPWWTACGGLARVATSLGVAPDSPMGGLLAYPVG